MIEIPGYRIEREFGEGGMATVYLAVQESLDRPVAIKVLSRELVSDSEFCNRFLRESKTLATVSQHPNIVTIIDSGEHDGVFYMIMELMPGGALNERLESGSLSPAESVEIIKKVAAALSWSHRKGLIHRDVKPANVLFSEDGSPVLSDFGIAKTTQENATRMTAMGMAIGTPTYMSPEQASAKEVTPKSDQYSLGIMLFEMLAGNPPFDAETAVLVAVQHIQGEIPQLPPGVSQFQAVINRMMAKDPDDRFDTLEELTSALDNLPSNKTEFFAAPDSTTQATEAPATPATANPKRTLAIGGGVIATLLVAGIAYWWIDENDDSGNDINTVVTSEADTVVVQPERPPNPEVEKWLEIAQSHFEIGRLFEPPGNNALESFWKVLEMDATNPEAVKGTKKIAALLEPLARESFEKDDIDESKLLVEKGLLADPGNQVLMELQKEIDAR